MAYDFNGSNQYISGSFSAITDEPLTIACWANSDSQTTSQVLFSLGNNGAAGSWNLALGGNAAGDFVQAIKQNDGGTQAFATSSTGYTAGTWHHCAAIFESNTSRYAAIDGVTGSQNTTSVTDPTPDFITIGCLRRSATSNFLDGRGAEAAAWRAVLSADELAALARGVSPLLIRPQSLVFYVPLVRDIIDYKGLALTPTNSPTVATHPRVFMPRRRGIVGVAAGGGSSFKDLAGSIAVQTAFAGSSGIVFGIGGAVAAQTAFNGALKATFAVQGAVQAQATFAGDLTVTATGAPVKELAGAIAVQTAFNAALKQRLALGGSIAAQTAFAGQLKQRLAVAGSFASQFTFAGTLTAGVVTVTLSGSISAAVAFGSLDIETESGAWSGAPTGSEVWTTASEGGELWAVQGSGSEAWTRQ